MLPEAKVEIGKGVYTMEEPKPKMEIQELPRLPKPETKLEIGKGVYTMEEPKPKMEIQELPRLPKPETKLEIGKGVYTMEEPKPSLPAEQREVIRRRLDRISVITELLKLETLKLD